MINKPTAATSRERPQIRSGLEKRSKYDRILRVIPAFSAATISLESKGFPRDYPSKKRGNIQ
jgi:hypothetical protein